MEPITCRDDDGTKNIMKMRMTMENAQKSSDKKVREMEENIQKMSGAKALAWTEKGDDKKQLYKCMMREQKERASSKRSEAEGEGI